jgi:hypothetical protein
MCGISLLTEHLLASHEGLCSVVPLTDSAGLASLDFGKGPVTGSYKQGNKICKLIKCE